MTRHLRFNLIQLAFLALVIVCAAAQSVCAADLVSDPIDRADRAERAAGRQHGVVSQTVAEALDILASLYEADGRYPDATKALERALEIHERLSGAGSAPTATVRHRLAQVAFAEGRTAETERLLKQALAMRQVELGDYHPEVAAALDDLAVLYRATGRDAEPLLKRSVTIREWNKAYEPLAYGRALNVLAAYYVERERLDDAIAASEQALAIDEAALDTDSAIIATDLSNLAALYQAAGRRQAAKTMYRRAVDAWDASLEPDNPEIASTLDEYAQLLRDLGNVVQAREAESRAAAIRATARFQ